MQNVKNDRAAWLRGGTAQCDVPPQPAQRPLRLVLLGAPGSGKGTQAELLAQRLGGCHLSTGDIFRNAACSGKEEASPAVREAFEVMARGELVKDETVLAMVRERTTCLRCMGGILLDGFPRTVAQADALADLLIEQNLSIDAVINFELPIDTIVRRLGGRRVCADCKAVYHVDSNPPQQEGLCDHCGGKLLQRDDDRPEAVLVRMKAYERETAPLIEYYRKRGLLLNVSADGAPKEVCERTVRLLMADDSNS